MCAIDSSTTGSRSNNPVAIPRRLLRHASSERGAGVIEMAFVVILMISLMVGAVDLGFAYQHYGVVLNASRESARLYSRLPCTGGNRNALRSAIIDAAVTEGGGGKVTILRQNVLLTPNPTAGCPTTGSSVEVRVNVRYESQFGALVGLGEIPISATTTMVYFGTDTSQSGS